LTLYFRFGCFQLQYPELEGQFSSADLSPYNNLWWNIHDFTPTPGEGPNWTLLGECYKVQDYLPLPEMNDLRQVEISFSNSTVPSTIGSRTRADQNETTLVLVFNEEDHKERARKMLAKMVDANQQIELIKSRNLVMDVRKLFKN
jgi:hypothetical protein